MPLTVGVTSDSTDDATLETSEATEETTLLMSCVVEVASGSDKMGPVPVAAYVVVNSELGVAVAEALSVEALADGVAAASVVLAGSRVDRRPPRRPPLVVDVPEVDHVDRLTIMASLELLESFGRASDWADALEPAVGETLSLT